MSTRADAKTAATAAELTLSQTSALTSSSLVRGVWTFLGFVLMASSAGIWLVPNAGGDTAFVLIKFVASITFFAVGITVSQFGRKDKTFEVHLDQGRGEFRFVERGGDGIARTREVLSYSDLSRIDTSDGMLRALSHKGHALIEIPMSQIDNQAELMVALKRG